MIKFVIALFKEYEQKHNMIALDSSCCRKSLVIFSDKKCGNSSWYRVSSMCYRVQSEYIQYLCLYPKYDYSSLGNTIL